jgi:hypothetical protein
MIALMGDTPDDWINALHIYWNKVLKSSDQAAVVRGEIMEELADHPELAEVLGRIGQKNTELLDDIRATFYGNPNRSQVERWLNSYLLYWPISYQIKAVKWMLRIMFDRAGGLKTNAAGAYALDQLASLHMDLMENDPDYAKFFEDYSTLVFVAQMMVPMTPTQMGVSLSPPVRNVMAEAAGSLPFLTPDQQETWGGYAKAILDVGPVYTFKTLVPQLGGELYPALKDVPGAGALYRMAVGRKPPKPKKAEDSFWQPDTSRWGG